MYAISFRHCAVLATPPLEPPYPSVPDKPSSCATTKAARRYLCLSSKTPPFSPSQSAKVLLTVLQSFCFLLYIINPQATLISIPFLILMTSGLEFDDVLLFNFFKDSPTTAEWRLFLNYFHDVLVPLQVDRKPGDDTILPTNGPLFGSASAPLDASQLQYGMVKFKLFESELKQLYVAVTRPRVRLWIFDECGGTPVLDFFSVRCCVIPGVPRSLLVVAQLLSTS